jgi:ATP-dependent DNA helicase RecG
MFYYCPIYVKDATPLMEKGDIFKLTVRYEKEENFGAENFVKVGVTTSIKHADKILELIRENPKITAYQLVAELSLSERGVRKILAQLVNLKFIERKGSKKNGEWIIIETYN